MIAAAPALPAFYGVWAAATLVAIVLGVARILRPAEAAMACLAGFFMGASAGLLAFDRWHSPSAIALWTGIVCAGFAAATVLTIRRARRTRRSGGVTWTTPAGIVLAGTSAFLLASFGAQVLAAPVTVPAMWWVSRGTGPALRVTLAIIASLTMLFVGTMLAWFLAHDNEPTAFALSVGMAAATIVAFAWPKRVPGPSA